ncbi:uncharacterized protein LOC144578666 [Callithrix jacchus]
MIAKCETLPTKCRGAQTSRSNIMTPQFTARNSFAHQEGGCARARTGRWAFRQPTTCKDHGQPPGLGRVARGQARDPGSDGGVRAGEQRARARPPRGPGPALPATARPAAGAAPWPASNPHPLTGLHDPRSPRADLNFWLLRPPSTGPRFPPSLVRAPAGPSPSQKPPPCPRCLVADSAGCPAAKESQHCARPTATASPAKGADPLTTQARWSGAERWRRWLRRGQSSGLPGARRKWAVAGARSLRGRSFSGKAGSQGKASFSRSRTFKEGSAPLCPGT